MAHLPPLERALRDKVQLIFLLIQLPMRKPKARARNRRQNRNNHVIPHQPRIRGYADECLTDSVGHSAHEQEHGRDDRAHVFRCFSEGILQASNGSEDLGESNQEVGDGLHPDVDGCWADAVRG